MLLKPLEWEITEEILPVAQNGMNYRANLETKGATKDDIREVHGEILPGYLTYKQAFWSLLYWYKKVFGKNITGTVVELGAGTGTMSSLFSKRKEFDKIYAVEYCREVVYKTMPIVFDFLKADKKKINRVVGDFNNIKLNDSSIDLVIEVGSFHHSENLPKTLAEVSRILKKGGVLICHERAHPDSVTDEKLDKLRNQELPESLKIKYGIPVEKKFSRADWGEHEYRQGEWTNYFQKAGFDVFIFREAGYSIKGFSRALLLAPWLDPVMWYSIKTGRAGEKNMRGYSYSHNRIAFLCIKK